MIYEVGSGKTYSTITAALAQLYTDVGSNAFTETQTIRVYDGTYTETVAPDTNLNPTADYGLVIEAAAGNSPVIDGESTRVNGIYVLTIDYVTSDGFTVKNCTTNGIYYYSKSRHGIIKNNVCYSNGHGIHVYTSSTYATVNNNFSFSNTGDGIWFENASHYGTVHSNNCYLNGNSGIDIKASTNMNIYNCNCYSNSTYGMNFRSGANSDTVCGCICYSNTSHGIYAQSTNSNLTIHDCIFYSNLDGVRASNTAGVVFYNNYCYSNSSNGLLIYTNSTNSIAYNNVCIFNKIGLQFNNATGGKIYNNTCALNTNNAIYGNSGATGLTSKNNILYQVNGAACAFYGASSGLSTDYNCFYFSGTAVPVSGYATLALWQATGRDLNSINSDPLFLLLNGLSASDYKLSYDSPCINVATDLSATFTIDYFGTTRPAGAWDMGFHEFIPATLSKARIVNQGGDGLGLTKTSIVNQGGA